MCIHVYESDSDQRVMEQYHRAVEQHEAAKESDTPGFADWYGSQVQRIQAEINRRFFERALKQPAKVLVGW